MIYSILYILLDVTLYVDIGVARALGMAIDTYRQKNINILLRVSLCAPYFVILRVAWWCRTLSFWTLFTVMLSTRSVILNGVNVAIKPSAKQVYLLCRGGARSRNSRISSATIHYHRCLWSALRRCFAFAQHDIQCDWDCHGLFQASQWRRIACSQRGDPSLHSGWHRADHGEEILRYTQDDIISNIALQVSLHRTDLPTPKITKSHNNIITGGVGSVISVTKWWGVPAISQK